MGINEIKRLQLIGFRRWYERQLISGHASLVLALLCVVLVACGFELMSLKETNLGFIGQALIIILGAFSAWHAMKRYQRIMLEAEYIGSKASCSACGRYGFVWPKDDPPLVIAATQPDQEPRVLMIKACCKKCAHRWEIDLDERSAPSGF